jgi:hypothetical protein
LTTTLCRACWQDITVALTCDAQQREGVTYYGGDIDADWYRNDVAPHLPARCRDCGVARGGLHHPHCTQAGCTRCNQQRATCTCDDRW